MSDLPMVSITIEGEFIDSFIYSGTLFLVGMNGTLKTYSWKELVTRSLANSVENKYRTSLFSLLTDSRISAKPIERTFEDETLFSIQVDAQFLSKYEGISFPIEDWPTDLSIYANRLYISSDRGVESRRFSWDTGHVKEFEKPLLIWDELSFRIAPNAMNRIAIAAGNSGLLIATPHERQLEKDDLRQLLDTPCRGCDWQESTLVADTATGSVRADFERLPKRNSATGDMTEYWKITNSLKRLPPRTLENICIGQSNAHFSWLGGNKLFAIDEEFRLFSRPNYSSDSEVDMAGDFELVESIRPTEASERLHSIRSGIFGTLAEFTTQLVKFTENGVTRIANSPGRWRTFPRSRSYANHIHVIEDYCLRVLAFETNFDKKNNDKFSFALESLRNDEE